MPPMTSTTPAPTSSPTRIAPRRSPRLTLTRPESSAPLFHAWRA